MKAWLVFLSAAGVALWGGGCRRPQPDTPTAVEAVSVSATAEEGGFLTYELRLSGRRRTDLVLTGQFSVADYPTDYANPTDYEPAPEYSLDGGASWAAAPDKRSVSIPPSAAACQIRFKTLDDQAPEVLEERLSILLRPLDPGRLAAPIPELKAVITDNDVPQSLRTRIARRKYLAVFEKQGAHFIATGAATGAASAFQKELIDTSFADLIRLTEALAGADSVFEKVRQLLIGYDGSSQSLGAVQFLEDADGHPDLARWTMYLNLAQAYTGLETQKPQAFDPDGQLSATIVHELAHILTLDDTQRTLVDSPQECPAVFVTEPDEQSCFTAAGYVGSFLSLFYDTPEGVPTPKPGLPRPNFINLYSKVDYAEDLAESFLGYVCLEPLPTGASQASYLRKLIFYDGYPQAQQIKGSLRSTGYPFKNNDENTAPPFAYARRASNAAGCLSKNIRL